MAIKIEVAGSYNDRDIKRAQADLQKLGDAAGTNSKTFGEKFEAMGDALVDFGGKMTTRVTLPIVAAGAGMFALFTKQEDAMARMTGALRANGGQANVTADEITNLAKRLQETTTFGDEATISAAGLLLTFHNVRNELGEGNRVFDRTLIAAQDLSAALGTDLESATMQLAKAMESPTRGMSALSRSGTTFTEQQREMVKAMEESGDILGAQKLVLEVVEGQYGGMAETMAGTSSGKMKQAFNELGDAGEEFGEIIAQVVNKVTENLKRVGEFFQNLSTEQKEMIVTVLGLAAAIGPLALGIGKVVKVLSILSKGVMLFNKVLLMNPIGLVVVALVALGVLLYLAYQRFEGFREVVDKAFSVIKDVVAYAWENVIKPIFTALVEAVQEHLVPVIQELWAKFQEAWPGIQSALETAWGVIQPILAFLIDLFVQIYTKYLTTLIKVWATVFTGVVNALKTAWSIIRPIFNAVRNFIVNQLVPRFQGFLNTARTVWQGVSGAISTAWGGISSVFDSIKRGIDSVAQFMGVAVGAIKRAFSGVASAISAPFRIAFQTIRDIWNSTLGGKGFDVPDWPGLPFRGQSFRFPEFNKGGIVPGIPGEAQLAVLHAGEMVLRQSQIDRYQGKGGGGGGDTYNITINGMVGRDKRDILEYLARELPKAAVKAGRSYG